jgi:putative endonuclease
MGEIDLILEDGDCLVFAEIRYRKSSNFGTGAETVTRAKQMRIIQTASRYLQYHEQRATQPCRFDVVSMGKVNGELEINWIRNAFTST